MTGESKHEGVAVHAGFPNPATDASLGSLDLNRLLISHGASTYFFKIEGKNWEESGVFEGDIALVDRALDPLKNDVVVWWNSVAGEFSISIFQNMPKEAQLWGVITSTIHQFKKFKNND